MHALLQACLVGFYLLLTTFDKISLTLPFIQNGAVSSSLFVRDKSFVVPAVVVFMLTAFDVVVFVFVLLIVHVELDTALKTQLAQLHT